MLVWVSVCYDRMMLAWMSLWYDRKMRCWHEWVSEVWQKYAGVSVSGMTERCWRECLWLTERCRYVWFDTKMLAWMSVCCMTESCWREWVSVVWQKCAGVSVCGYDRQMPAWMSVCGMTQRCWREWVSVAWQKDAGMCECVCLTESCWREWVYVAGQKDVGVVRLWNQLLIRMLIIIVRTSLEKLPLSIMSAV